jgi:hypothetical protein
MKRWISTTFVATVVCVLGAGTLFVTWADATVVYYDPSKPRLADGSIQAQALEHDSYPGYQFWHAQAAAAGFLGLLLLLVATGGLEPAPIWRSLVQIATGAALVGVVVAGLNSHHAMTQGDKAAGRAVTFSWGAGNFVVIALAVIVTLIGAIEIRGLIGRKGPEQSGAGPAKEPVS